VYGLFESQGRYKISFHQSVVSSRRNSNSGQRSLLKMFGTPATLARHIDSLAGKFGSTAVPHPGSIPTTRLISGRLHSRFVIHSLECALH